MTDELRAKWFFENNKVHLCSASKVFNVTNETNKVNSVSLFPVESCSCAERKGCAHILAAKLSTGIPIHKKNIKKQL